MTLIEQISADIKAAMKAREKEKLEALRAVKSALLLAGTEAGANGEVSDEAGLKSIQKLVKQRKDAAAIYQEQDREDLAGPELAQAAVMEAYLPAQMGADEVKAIIQEVITHTGASGMGDMGKVMGAAMGKLQGKADGKLISSTVKELLA
jgi:uncharacterized protein YqeY